MGMGSAGRPQMGGGKGQPQQPQPMQSQPAMGGGKGQPQPMQSQSYMPPPQMGGGKGQPQQPGYTPFPQMPPQMGGGKGQPAQYPFPQLGGGKGGNQPRGTLVGFGPTDAPIYSNDPNAVPYTGGSMGGYYVNGVPGPAPQRPAYTGGQQPRTAGGYGVDLSQYVNTISGQPGKIPYNPTYMDIKQPPGQQLAPGAVAPTQAEIERLRPMLTTPSFVPQQPVGLGQPIGLGQAGLSPQQYADLGTAGPGAIPYNPTYMDIKQPPQLAPKPFVPQPVRAEAPQQAQQRALQQMANAKRFGMR